MKGKPQHMTEASQMSIYEKIVGGEISLSMKQFAKVGSWKQEIPTQRSVLYLQRQISDIVLGC